MLPPYSHRWVEKCHPPLQLFLAHPFLPPFRLVHDFIDFELTCDASDDYLEDTRAHHVPRFFDAVVVRNGVARLNIEGIRICRTPAARAYESSRSCMRNRCVRSDMSNVAGGCAGPRAKRQQDFHHFAKGAPLPKHQANLVGQQ